MTCDLHHCYDKDAGTLLLLPFLGGDPLGRQLAAIVNAYLQLVPPGALAAYAKYANKCVEWLAWSQGRPDSGDIVAAAELEDYFSTVLLHCNWRKLQVHVVSQRTGRWRFTRDHSRFCSQDSSRGRGVSAHSRRVVDWSIK